MFRRKHRVLPTIDIAAIRSGDLLAWKSDPYSSIGDFFTQSIRVLTRSQYGHVGIAWRCHDGIGDELFVIEATIPRIRVARVVADSSFDCIPMYVPWEAYNKEFLVSKIGLPYSYMDALRAFYGWTLEDKDDRWQCAELSNEFYQASGLYFTHDNTPKGLINSILKDGLRKIYTVIDSRSLSAT